ncbi:MAG: type II toxin-antitoxin system RelE/ParE family toxin [Candidatus Aminicenantes bacterium]|nr:type II toxin-antitoxin system RelE/ParE family toxin [Candidatus Aminicenantes bacterium]
MIKSFEDKEREKVYHRGFSKKFPIDVQKIGLRKLRMLYNSQSLQDLKAPPGNRLEKLRGKREGQYSIRINEQWRVCFFWRENDAYGVEITDYH